MQPGITFFVEQWDWNERTSFVWKKHSSAPPTLPFSTRLKVKRQAYRINVSGYAAHLRPISCSSIQPVQSPEDLKWKWPDHLTQFLKKNKLCFSGQSKKKTFQWNLEDSVLLSKIVCFKVLKDQQFDWYFVRQIDNKCLVWKKSERGA